MRVVGGGLTRARRQGCVRSDGFDRWQAAGNRGGAEILEPRTSSYFQRSLSLLPPCFCASWSFFGVLALRIVIHSGLERSGRGHHVPALTVTSGGRDVGSDVACSYKSSRGRERHSIRRRGRFRIQSRGQLVLAITFEYDFQLHGHSGDLAAHGLSCHFGALRIVRGRGISTGEYRRGNSPAGRPHWSGSLSFNGHQP